ncbi:CoA pyrophosphatase [Erythrobacter sp. Alg231-14]|uniref:CoA pyrophosphatase n=1 Tax=Erythrobacter sp. Alg231-14 TaxID=1922225 RepID=UPI000D553DBC
MSALFNRLSTLFEEGHAHPVTGLKSDAEFVVAGEQTPAAVLIAVTDQPEPTVILTQRPTGMRSHPGQVAFPGGKLDPGEDAITAALREAEEELALPREVVQVVGTSDLFSTGTGFDVTPVLAVVPPNLDLKPNPAEVEAWFDPPLSLLLERDNWIENETFWRGSMRSYLDMHYDGFRIWGVTAAIIANLALRIPPERLKTG